MAQINLTETARASITTPASGKDAVYIDSSSGQMEVKNSSGTSRSADNTVYRTLHEAQFHIGSAITSGTFLPNTSSVKTGNDIGANMFEAFYFSASDYGQSIKLRVRAQLSANATSPGTITFTFGLYSVTVAGAASTFVPTLGTVVTGSTVALANPSASAIAQGNSGDFTTSAANFTDNTLYCIGLVTNATSATNGFVKGTAQLQVRNA